MRRRFALLGIGIAMTAAQACAQTSPAPSADPSAKTEEQVLSFRNADQDRMTVPVIIADAGPFDFLVDTGAERSVVSTELARSLKLAPGGGARLFDFTGESAVDTVAVPAMSVGRLGARALEAPSLAAGNLGAPGMLGIDALQGHRIVIDFNRKRMTLIPSKRHASGEYVVRATNHVGQLIITDAEFYGKPIAVIVDTGSWLSVGNSAMLALAKHRPRPFRPVEVISVTGRSFNAELVTVNELRIGGVTFGNFGLAFADVPPFTRFGLRDTPTLILGMSSLKLFQRVEIDFTNREVGFTLPIPPLDFRSLCRNTTSACHSY